MYMNSIEPTTDENKSQFQLAWENVKWFAHKITLARHNGHWMRVQRIDNGHSHLYHYGTGGIVTVPVDQIEATRTDAHLSAQRVFGD